MSCEVREPIILENEGQKIFALFHRPKGLTHFPAVLICHGFGGNKIGANRLYVLQAELLTKIGIAALRIDFRGSGDSEGDFHEMTLEGEVSDILTALKFLENHPQVDTARLGLLGASLGGVVALMAAERTQKFKTLALWAPVAHTHEWRAGWDKARNFKELTHLEHNGRLVSRQFCEEFFSINPKKSMDALNGVPMFHIHGCKDDIVPLSHREHYVSWRERASAPNKFLVLDECDHTFSHLKEQKILIEETANWFKQTLEIT